VEQVRVVCAHDCPDMCSLIAHVEKDRVVKIEGDPDQPLTAGFACAKVNRDMELVHSPERISTPLRRTGPKGKGEFTPITWDEALDEITTRWKAIIAESGPLAILGYAYSAHQGLMNRGLVNGLFHALGTSRLMAGTVCDTCCEAAWDATLGPVGGADPESVADSDLIIAWGADLMATNVHVWAKAEEARKKGAKRGSTSADPHGRRGRLAPADPNRHGCRACPRHRTYPGTRRSAGPRLYRGSHRRLRETVRRGAAALRAGARCRDHRPLRR
jgi:anaerobic selenocysteine-containing dehydrogenase